MLVRRLIRPLSLEVLRCTLLCSRSGSLRHSIRQLSPIATKFRIKCRKYADQLSPGGSSVALSLGEGNRQQERDGFNSGKSLPALRFALSSLGNT